MTTATPDAELVARQNALADALERTSLDLLDGAAHLVPIAQAEPDPARRVAIEAEITSSRRDGQRYLQEVWAWRETGELPSSIA